jgi:hypothetical protein
MKGQAGDVWPGGLETLLLLMALPLLLQVPADLPVHRLSQQ